MIYTVTFNPSLDYVVTVDDLKKGALNRSTSERILAGGKGINVSTLLKSLGCESTALGFAAGFTGRELTRLVEERGIKADFIELSRGASRINVKLKTQSGAVWEETEINARGVQPTAQDIERLYKRLDKLVSGDTLVLAGSIPSGMSETAYRDIMEHLRGKNISIVVDTTGKLLESTLPFKPFLIKPNNHELGELFNVQITDKDEALFYAKRLQEKGARNVLVSMAGDGAVLASEDGGQYKLCAPQGKVINSVGAGDSVVAGFLYGYMESGDYEKAFRLGVCAGSASAFSEEIATREEVMRLVEHTAVMPIT